MSNSASAKPTADKPVKGYKEIGQYMVIDPRVCFGKLTFKGTRVPVATILSWLAKGSTIDSILADWPYLPREAVEASIRMASLALVESAKNGAAHRMPCAEPPRRKTMGKKAS